MVAEVGSVRWSGKSGQNTVYSFLRQKDSPQPARRRRFDTAFRTEALRLAEESRSTQAAARPLKLNPKRL